MQSFLSADTSHAQVSEIAQQLGRAFATITLPDHGGTDEPATILEEARKLFDQIPRSPEPGWPLNALDQAHGAAACTITFAPIEPDRDPQLLKDYSVVLSRTTQRAPLWALDIHFLGKARLHPVPPPLPCPGLFRTEALNPSLAPGQRALLIAESASKAATSLHKALRATHAFEAHLTRVKHGFRSTSTAPKLLRILDGFGPLRASQLCSALNLSRNGLRRILSALDPTGLIETRTRHGVTIVSARSQTVSLTTNSTDDLLSLAPSSIASFDEAMAEIDILLERHSQQSM